MKKTTIGFIESVKISNKTFKARIDTGATVCSIDKALAKKLKLGPHHRTAKVISSHGKSVRPVVRASIEIKGRKFRARFNLADRKNLTYPVLIGRNILKRGFIIDPSHKK